MNTGHRPLLCAFVASLAVALPLADLHAQLFTDTFNRLTVNDTTGQGGSLAGLTYTNFGDSGGGNFTQTSANQLNIVAGASNWVGARLDHDFVDSSITAAGGFTISFDFDPFPGTVGNIQRGATFTLGQTDTYLSGANEFAESQASTPLGIRFRNDRLTVFRAGTSINYLFADIDISIPADGVRNFSMTVNTDDFSIGGDGTFDVFINGFPVNLGANDTIAWTTGENYLALAAWDRPTDGVLIDNLIITTIPEPGSVALVGLVGLVGLLTRRRRH